MKKNHSKNSIIVTLCIYSLLGYIIVSAGITFFKSVISQQYLVQTIKNTTKQNIPFLQYISKDTNLLPENNKISNTLSRMVDSPVITFAKAQNNVNIAENVNSSFITNEHNLNDYTGGMDADKVIFDYNQQDNIDKNQGKQIETQNNEAQNAEVTPTQPPVNPQINGNTATVPIYQKAREIGIDQLSYDFLLKNYYTVVSSTTLKPSDVDASKLMNMDMTISTPNTQPQILIYHTHGQEAFADSTPNDPNTGVMGVGNYLTKLLTEQYGYNVIHITDSFDYVNGVLDRNKAYDYAYNRIAQVLTENPSIEVVIDLHRDGVNDNLHLVTDINGKQTAQIMFFNGLSRLNSIGEIGYLYNPYREQNLALSMQLKVKSEEYFDGFTRKNYIQAYEYNMSLRPKSLLIEAGAQTNTFQEELNAMEPLAMLLDQEFKK